MTTTLRTPSSASASNRKRTQARRLLAFVLGCLVTTGPLHAEPTPTLDAIRQRGKLVVGVKFDVPFFGLNNPVTRRVEGFEADLAREFARDLLGSPEKVEFVEAVSANRIPFLQADRVDLIISTMTINPERQRQIDFSEVYYEAGQSILVRKGSGIHGLSDLAGKTVTSPQGTTSERVVRERVPTARQLLFKAHAECFAALQNGQADAFSNDDALLLSYLSKDPARLELVGGKFTVEPWGVGVKKGRPDLLAFVNAELGRIKREGRWRALYDRNLKPATGASAEPPTGELPAAPSPAG